MTILIPAYEPDRRLIKLISELQEKCDFNIIIVDDGSDPRYRTVFEKVIERGCTVLTHEINQGKGCALKTGFTYILHGTNEDTGVITADADGQHLVDDIIGIAAKISQSSENIVLGVRKFVGKVPFRSAVGNVVTRAVFTFVSGEKIMDTQTGLRGFPLSILPWLISLEGERFEYEMNMLLKAKSVGYQFTQINIETVYFTGNKSSHFRIIQDSIRVYLPFLMFCLSGLSSATVDYFMLFLLQWFSKNLLFSVIGARLVSSVVNFTINRFFVFNSVSKKQKTSLELFYYYMLVCTLLMVNYLLLRFLSQDLRINLFWSKVLTELALFGFSFAAQHLFVFREKVQL